MKRIISTLISIFIVLSGTVIASHIHTTPAEGKCIALTRHARNFEFYFLTEWQKRECDVVGIEVDAPTMVTSKSVE